MDPLKEVLNSLLAETYTLFLMTQNYHWNVKGNNFYELHKLFESHYDEMFKAIDEIAERISGLGNVVPGSFKEFIDLSELKIETNLSDSRSMLLKLKEGHEHIISSLEKGLDIAGEQADEDSFDLMVQRLKAHNKMHWMISKSID
ncbi:DNA starvation/stationary phase protection protein [Candidatus Dojkabacteria bacterium]|nr:DNA starvation/stationary phase protection protein [Candidatus Dojkabacteria bacterium]